MQKARKIAIASGKGGVGKSMIASSLALLFSQDKNITCVDCDVDAPNLGLWLGITEHDKTRKISTSVKARIKSQQALDNGVLDICHFGAISKKNGAYKINPFLCEGCSACQVVYPDAIKLEKMKTGR